MKIERLQINGFKNLENVEVDFVLSGNSVVLVGANGSGKSNLLEAIATIFSDLSLKRSTAFIYDMTYSVKSHTVRVRNTPSGMSIQVTRPGSRKAVGITVAEFYGSQPLLPPNIFGYYSGTRTNLAEIFAEHESVTYASARLSVSDSVKDDEGDVPQRLHHLNTMRRFFYGHLKNSPLVMLSYFASGKEGLQDFLKAELSINDFDSALLILNRPLWFQKVPKGTKRGFPWDVTGYLDNEIGAFLLSLWGAALVPFETEIFEGDSRDMSLENEPVARDKIFLFFPDLNSLSRLFKEVGSEQQLFVFLETLSVLGILEDTKVWVTRDGVKEEISSKEISDGEKQLLTIVGLLYLTPGEETLFLLDEPDTHLNPSWKWDFLQTIKKYAGDTASCQFILTSHDPLTVASLKRDDVQIVSKNRTTGRTEFQHPPVDPQGLGVAGVLRQIFGMPTTLDPETQKLIDDRNRLLARQDSDKTVQEELAEINRKLDVFGLAYQSRDPDYDIFLRTKHSLLKEKQENYTPSEISEQEEFVRKLLEKPN